MKIYFVRHGKTEWNKLKKMQGSADIPLNEEGIEQAYKTKELISNIEFDCAICSPLTRTSGVRIDIWTHFMRGCIIELCTPI